MTTTNADNDDNDVNKINAGRGDRRQQRREAIAACVCVVRVMFVCCKFLFERTQLSQFYFTLGKVLESSWAHEVEYATLNNYIFGNIIILHTYRNSTTL